MSRKKISQEATGSETLLDKTQRQQLGLRKDDFKVIRINFNDVKVKEVFLWNGFLRRR